ncbi:hypothetical protein POJ06DRAFT_295671 [Lipomyces tetrasporus]|uniref:SWIM-type domain-containing protein n=1 Tax=Lipomyces tetrasporus TaxID=54092 RepID=A0AAD7QT08_9ASCO|nr:uncharacterized protein POJ06DRAFT_295671 [Lipomyces tetrasporus]KAJ8100814.1 hypothetical protein POJ06DRAFT_295671 [Lipomyces tetrasporus]
MEIQDPNFGISTTSRVEGSHGAMKGGLTSAQQLSVIGSNETLFVRLEIRNQIETPKLCTTISRSALELVYAEVVKKLHQQEEESSRENCGCSTWNRYLLPCSHRIELGVSISITDIHPRWWVHPKVSPLNVAFQHIDTEMLLHLKDPPAALPRKAEAVQIATDQIEKVRRCGSCKNTGHNRRKCPKLLSNLTTTENGTTAKDQEEGISQQLVTSNDADFLGDEGTAGYDHDYRDEEFAEMWSDVFSLI